MFKKKGAASKATIRKRARPAESESSSGGSSDEGASKKPVRPDKKGKRGLAFAAEKRDPTADENAGGGGGGGLNDGEDDVLGNTVKSSRDGLNAAATSDATRYTEIDTSADRDARAILERNVKMNAEGLTNDETKVYRGMAGYKNYVTKQESQVGGNKHTGTQGPIRAPQFLRASCRFDYQPDICKDYKETGFCGFGDSCKFIHDRGDYKSGWQIEKEWEEAQKKKRAGDSGGGASAAGDDGDNEYAVESDDELPFACFICREG
ncbi:unnamed protein product, partial [Phaeothamnion confervicola]